MKHSRPWLVMLILSGLMSASARCKNDSTTSPSSSTPLTTTEVYTGSLVQGGSGFYSFTVINAGNATVTLGSLTESASGRALDAAMGLGVGVPAGEGCNLSSSMTAAPGLTTQLTHAVTAGIYCVQISDVGNLRVQATFGVRIVHP